MTVNEEWYIISLELEAEKIIYQNHIKHGLYLKVNPTLKEIKKPAYDWNNIEKDTTFSSEVGFPDQLSFLSDDFSLEIELISYQKQSKVHLQNELWKIYLYQKFLLQVSIFMK